MPLKREPKYRYNQEVELEGCGGEKYDTGLYIGRNLSIRTNGGDYIHSARNKPVI